MPRKSTKAKTAAPPVPVPQSEAEAIDAIARIGAAQRQRAVIEAAMNENLARVKLEAETEAKPLAEQIEGLTKGLQTWCAANRDRLTAGGKVKFHKFASGEVSWRSRPPKVTIKGVEAVIEAIKALGLGKKFLRTKEEPNKEAMLADRDAARRVAGITIGSDGEDFVVKPFETELEEVAS